MTIDPIAESQAIRGWLSGSRSAGAALVTMHRGIIIYAVSPMVTPRCELDDLVQVGSMAMLKSTKSYRADRGTFANHAVGAIRWNARKYKRTVKYDLTVSEVGDEAVAADLRGTEPRSVVAVRLKHNRAAIEACAVSALRLDAPVGDGDETYLSLLAQPANDIVEHLDVARLRACVARLPKRERDVLTRRLSGDEETLEEIGASIGLTKERVRQIERDGLDRLKQRMGRAA